MTDQRGAAVDMLSRRALRARTDEKGPVGDERAWLAQARQRVADKHGERMRAIIALEPSIEATALADRLEPAPHPAKPQEGPLDAMQQAQRATFQRNDERRSEFEGPRSTREQAMAHLAKLRASCRPAGRT